MLVDELVEVHGHLCFVGADWPLLQPPFVVQGVAVAWPRKLYKVVTSDGPLEPSWADNSTGRSQTPSLPRDNHSCRFDEGFIHAKGAS